VRGLDLFKTLQFVELFDRSINREKGPTTGANRQAL